MPEQITALTLTSSEGVSIHNALRAWAHDIEDDPEEIARLKALADLFMAHNVHLVPFGQATGQ